VLDGAGYHRSSVVVEKAKELNIKLHYLPPYSPNLNPIERLPNRMALMIFNRVRLPVVSMTLSTPVLPTL
jgi:hypothetical protein